MHQIRYYLVRLFRLVLIVANSYVRSDHTHQISSNVPSVDDVLTWNGSEWVAAELSSLETGTSFGDAFTARDLDFTNNADWAVSNPASRIRDPLNQALRTMAFDDTAEEGTGFYVELPPSSAGLTNITFTYWVKRRTSASGSDAVMRIYNRAINSNAPIGTWTTPTNFPTTTGISTVYQKQSVTFALSSLSLNPGILYQFELTRNPSNGSDNLSGDLLLKVSFS